MYGQDLNIKGHRFRIGLVPAADGSASTVCARAADAGGGIVPETDPAAVLLRSALIGHADLIRRGTDQPHQAATAEDTERHVLGYVADGASGEQCRTAVEEARRRLAGLVAPAAAVAAGASEVPEGCANLLWWDERANFGDAVGPWLVRRLTGRTPVNGWRRNLSVPPLAAVGSTAGWLEQDGTRVWGAGLMAPLAPDAVKRLAGLSGIRIHAVRGELTGAELRSQLGWTVPEVYGDPALLLPRFLFVPDGQASQGKVAVLPHLDHRGLFGNPLVSWEDVDLVHNIDARQGLERVVREIAAAKVCISSSLHGIIVAQAYGVPWVWVRIEDALIAGDTFKFRDFFTTLDSSAVSAVSITVAEARAMDPAALARKATLPRLKVSLDALLAAFPLPLNAY
jgi:hypothetical protein